MQVPVRVSFRRLPVSEAVEAACREEAARLERFHGRITSCRVVIDAPHRHHRKGNLFQIRVDVRIPGGEVVVNHEPPAHHDEDVYLAVREAFAQVRRRLEDVVRKRRGETKAHQVPPHGRIKSLGPEFGFIATPGGREVYFHRNSVLGAAFESLEVGTEVRFVEEMGDRGPQASTVRVAGRHKHLGPQEG